MTVRSSSSTNVADANAGVLTGTAPSGTVAGDRLYCWIVQDTNPSTFTPPIGEGWTDLTGLIENVSPDGQSAALFEKKVSNGSETYAFTSSLARRAIVQVIALTGRHATDAAVVSTPVENDSTNATPISVAITGLTALANDDCLIFYQLDQTAQTDVWSFTPPGGYTGLQNVANSDWITSGCAKNENVSAGATGTLTATATRSSGSGSAGFSGVLVSIPVAAGGGSPTVSTVSSNSANEGTSIVHTVVLSAAVSGSAAVYAISLGGGTATGGGVDYTSTLTNGMFSNSVTVSGGNISVPVGVSSFTITIPTATDSVTEGSETYNLTVGGITGVGTLTDFPVLTVSDVSVSNLSGNATFRVSMSFAKGTDVTFSYSTANGTATAGVDYTSTSGTGTILAGQTFVDINVPILP